MVGHDAGGRAVRDLADRDQQVLDADVLVLQPLGFCVGPLQHLDDARRGVDLDDVADHLRTLIESGRGVGLELGPIDAKRLEKVSG